MPAEIPTHGRQFTNITDFEGAGDFNVVVAVQRDAGTHGFFTASLFCTSHQRFCAVFGTPGRLALQILVGLLSAGLGCYWLARYLTVPLRQLRTATRRLATGDLSARGGEVRSKRHDGITELGRTFDRMAERLESLLNAQRRLLGDISHETRNPSPRSG
jgi:signal transduction histidine kinase